ncbi:hypothetical protein [Bacilliculturomica massiliensis]|uniref:hypothetical protein n=1 Tax=Bacilliculturomica massiliensis TaxID=1917867 RepID=UPI00102F5BE4|nr:hypothetical protein [Bacilliculturomica massiliensis]
MHRKAIAALLAVLMILGMSPVFCFADALDNPGVFITVNDIKGETMEVAVKIKGGTDSSFKAVGTVLEYNAAQLELVRWSTTAAIELNNVDTAKDGWAAAKAVESVSPEIVSGKPAMAFTSNGKGYLYMGAEAAVAQQFEQDQQLVTVRFRYQPGASFDTAKESIKYVTDDEVAFYSPVKGQMIYQAENPATGAYKFYYLRPLTISDSGDVTVDDAPPAGGQTIPTPENEVKTSDAAISAGTGTADPDDFVSYTFYDWDGTLLGTRVVAKNTGSLIDPNTDENRATYEGKSEAELTALGAAPIVPYGEKLENADKSVSTINKAGYSYAGWVDFDQTSTPDVSRDEEDGQTITGSGGTLVPLTGASENKVLRAAYNEIKYADGGIGWMDYDDDNIYLIEHSPFKASGMSYVKSTITVKRANTSRRSADGIYLTLSLRPRGLGETRLNINLGDSDLETYELVMPKLAYQTYANQAVTLTLFSNGGLTLSDPENIGASEMQVN